MTPDISTGSVASEKWAIAMRRLPADEQAGMLLAAQTLLRHPEAVSTPSRPSFSSFESSFTPPAPAGPELLQPMTANELPATGDWAAVDAAVHRLMIRLDMPLARLSRESGISETTIRYLSRSEKRQRSALVALSAALGCPHGYLVDVLHGTADAESPPPTASSAITEALRALDDKLTAITDISRVIDTKLGLLLNRQP